MSLVKVSGNASGTGTLTIAAPNTNSDYTLTLPTATGTVLSSADVATQANQETATSTATFVSPGRQQFHPSAAKAWHYTTYSAGSPTLQASYNVASLTDSGVGTLTVTLTTSFSSGNYAVTPGSSVSTSANAYDEIFTHNTGSWVQRHFESGGSLTDPANVQGVAFGDQ